jgi:hypothetical protein
MADDLITEPIEEIIDLTRAIADRLDHRRRESSNIAAAAIIATWAANTDQLNDIAEQLDDIGLFLVEAFGGDEQEEGEGEPMEGDDLEDDDSEEDQPLNSDEPKGEGEDASADPATTEDAAEATLP